MNIRYGVTICALMLAYAKGLMRDEDCEPTEIFTEGFLPSFAIFLVCFLILNTFETLHNLTHGCATHGNRSCGPHRIAHSTLENFLSSPLILTPPQSAFLKSKKSFIFCTVFWMSV